MNYYVVIPAHNEQQFLSFTLDSLLRQTLLPKRVIIVNDNSTDETENIIDSYTSEHSLFTKLNTTSDTLHMPGSKVVNAFKKGLALLDEDYDFLVKLDADIVLPDPYFEKIALAFRANPNIGIAGGFAYEEDAKGIWKRNHPMNSDHVRGAFKAYSKRCFKDIGGLKSAMGWDTVDELLARYHGYEIHTDENLHAKHLRPVGNAYNKKAKLLQGKAMYGMRYGYLITLIASLKMALKQRKKNAFFDNMEGYLEAERNNAAFLVSEAEGKYIRKLRWTNMRKKLLPF